MLSVKAQDEKGWAGKAAAEFDGMVTQLKKHRINVTVIQDTPFLTHLIPFFPITGYRFTRAQFACTPCLLLIEETNETSFDQPTDRDTPYKILLTLPIMKESTCSGRNRKYGMTETQRSPMPVYHHELTLLLWKTSASQCYIRYCI